MKKNIGLDGFRKEFINYNRTNFSYNGQEALFNYLTDLEEDTGHEIELDIIALCCDYTEYETLEDIQKDYDIKDIEELEDNTFVIKFDNGFIVEAY